ncbi:hypothetical protein GCM10022221_52850 [Actinocorallia aurea]
MRTEYEARFRDIDPEAVIGRLREWGAARTMGRTLMRRIVFENDEIAAKGGWLRLRDQGEKVTLTYKEVSAAGEGIEKILEAEIVVSGFGETRGLLEAMGFRAERYQENYREEWVLDGVAYDFDTWPGLPTFLEVEGPDRASVEAAVARLGLDLVDASYGSVDEVYLAVLGRDILKEPELLFPAE